MDDPKEPDFPQPPDFKGEPNSQQEQGEDQDLLDFELWAQESCDAFWVDSAEIPKELYSFYDSKPFSNCSACKNILGEAELYSIQKCYRGEEVVFEMAICQSCGEQCNQDFSEASLKVLEQFFVGVVENDLGGEGCSSCTRPLAAFRNYTQAGLCCGETLMVQLLVCEICEEAVQEKLSKQTRDRQDEFIRDNFPGVPADVDFSPIRIL